MKVFREKNLFRYNPTKIGLAITSNYKIQKLCKSIRLKNSDNIFNYFSRGKLLDIHNTGVMIDLLSGRNMYHENNE